MAPGSGRTFCVAMSKISRTSGIPCSSRRPEDLAALGRQGPHGGRTNTQDARSLLGRIPEQVDEQESGPLPRREPEEELPHVGAHLRIEESVTGLRDRDD